jgi:hypothetical protein
MSKRFIFISSIWLMVLAFWALTVLAEMMVDTAWVRRYNGPGNSSDVAYDMAIDGSGNVYVTGTSGTIKYDADGNQLWVGSWGGIAIVVDGSDNVCVITWSDSDGAYPYDCDYTTTKYYANGDTAWVRRYNGPGNAQDLAFAIAADDSGNVYVTGESYTGSETSTDYVTIKYYPNGDTAWLRRYNGPANDWDRAYAIAVDGSGNAYVTGYSRGMGTNADYATIKYLPNGDTAWVRRYEGTYWDEAYDIAVDGSGNVYVTGRSGTINLTIKYDANGNQLWVTPWGNNDIAVDDSGNVYVTQYSYTIIKLYPDGDTAWVRRYIGPDNELDRATDLTIDGSGNVYVTGYGYIQFAEDDTATDYATVKYDAKGNDVWIKRYNGPGNSEDRASAIALDDSGNVYVAGFSIGIGTGYDYTTIKYVQTNALRGDANRDGVIDIVDVVYLINYLFVHGPAPIPILQVGDVTCDGVIDASDLVYLLNYLFTSGPSPDC